MLFVLSLLEVWDSISTGVVHKISSIAETKKFLPVAGSEVCSEEPLGCWEMVTCSVLCLVLTKQPCFSGDVQFAHSNQVCLNTEFRRWSLSSLLKD